MLALTVSSVMTANVNYTAMDQM